MSPGASRAGPAPGAFFIAVVIGLLTWLLVLAVATFFPAWGGARLAEVRRSSRGASRG